MITDQANKSRSDDKSEKKNTTKENVHFTSLCVLKH